MDTGNVSAKQDAGRLFAAPLILIMVAVVLSTTLALAVQQLTPTTTTSTTVYTTVPYYTTTYTAAPYINITSTGSGVNGTYRNNDTLVWYAVVTPYAQTQLSIFDLSTGAEINVTNAGEADRYGDIGGSFRIGSNVPAGLMYLTITDLTAYRSAYAPFIKSKT